MKNDQGESVPLFPLGSIIRVVTDRYPDGINARVVRFYLHPDDGRHVTVFKCYIAARRYVRIAIAEVSSGTHT